ncbi:MAG: porin, partial [Planctomycetaceae bacterium]
FFWVKTPDGRGAGLGAWQLGVSLYHLDLDDSGLNVGQLDSMTFGINWFLNPNMKVQANYDITDRDFVNILNANGSGQVHGFGMRCAFDF